MDEENGVSEPSGCHKNGSSRRIVSCIDLRTRYSVQLTYKDCRPQHNIPLILAPRPASSLLALLIPCCQVAIPGITWML